MEVKEKNLTQSKNKKEHNFTNFIVTFKLTAQSCMI